MILQHFLSKRNLGHFLKYLVVCQAFFEGFSTPQKTHPQNFQDAIDPSTNR